MTQTEQSEQQTPREAKARCPQNLILFGDPKQSSVRETVALLVDWCAERSVGVLIDRALHEVTRPAFERNGHRLSPQLYEEAEGHATIENAGERAILVTLGGDGTLIRAIRCLWPVPIPVMGINLGSLGFNASVEPADIEETLAAWCAGTGTFSERMLLEAACWRGETRMEQAIAVNDVVIAKGTSEHIIHLRLSQGDDVVSSYGADGLIVATPTGSTAYNLSAGGPIVHPSLRAFVATAICPHTLAARPVILPDDPALRIDFERQHRPGKVTVCLDGQQVWTVEKGDYVTIKALGVPVRVIDNVETHYFSTLRQKFDWTGELKSSPLRNR